MQPERCSRTLVVLVRPILPSRSVKRCMDQVGHQMSCSIAYFVLGSTNISPTAIIIQTETQASGLKIHYVLVAQKAPDASLYIYARRCPEQLA